MSIDALTGRELSRPSGHEGEGTPSTAETPLDRKKGGPGVPATSIEAFQALDPHKVAGLRRRIAEHLAKGAGTARMVAEALDYDLQGITPRLAELRRMGVAETSGRMTNRTGVSGQAWVLTKNGMAWLLGDYDAPDPNEVLENRRRAHERLLRAVKAITSIRDTRDGNVLVPMHLCVELGLAEQRYREAKRA
jgi:hypothetical protein